MNSDYLKYTDYKIKQDDDGFKVNTDTVILGMSLDNLKGKTILDIGTNTGALLMYAYAKGAAYLKGIDINEKALKYADINLSSLTDKYDLECIDALNYEPLEKFDSIVCNPPFFEMNNVTIHDNLKNAMFEESLPLDILFQTYRKCMKEDGEIYMIYPADRFPELYAMALKYKLKIMKLRYVHDENKEYALRVIMKLKLGKMTKVRVLKPVLISRGEYEL